MSGAPARGHRPHFVGGALAGAIAALVQYQPTVSILGQETRLAASDPVVGAIALVAAIALLLGRLPFGIWRGKLIWPGIVAMSLVLAASFAIGYAATGEVSSWALQNRIFGWVILLAYLLSGSVLRVTYGSASVEAFLAIYLAVGAGVAAVSVSALMLVNFGVSNWLPYNDAQLRGLVDNPNAFGVLAVLALAAVWLAPLGRAEPLRGGLAALWSVAVFMSFSRAAWIACVVVVIGLFCLKRLPWRRALLWMALPVALAIALVWLGSFASTMAPKFEGAAAPPGQTSSLHEPGVPARLRLAGAALELWRGAPVLGAGLGAHWRREQAVNPAHPLLQHSTLLWLLAETGVVGLAVFAAFAGYALLLWLRARRRAAPADCVMEEVAVVFVCAFAVMSLFHDILYQRILWIALGLALAAPPAAGGRTAPP